MGCICSSGEIQDINPNTFYVVNIDGEGNEIKPGRLEITCSELIFYRDEAPSINWPLRCLRRYGWDTGMFSFESGRRSPTGVGIYAFMSPRAHEIFNLLQTRFAAEESLANMQNSASNCALFGPRRQTSTVDGYLEPIAPRLVPRSRVTSTLPNGGARVRLDSVDSCSEMQSTSPSTANPPTVVDNTRSEGAASAGFKQLWDPTEHRSDVERNNNGQEYSNGVLSQSGLRLLDSFPLGMKVNRLVDIDSSHVYMNIAPGTEPSALVMNPVTSAQCYTPTLSNLVILEESPNEPQHCYANLELPDQEAPQTNGAVNYAVLDLDQVGNVETPVNNESLVELPCIVPPDSPLGQAPPTPSGYVTIDFEKTTALSNSVLDRENRKS